MTSPLCEHCKKPKSQHSPYPWRSCDGWDYGQEFEPMTQPIRDETVLPSVQEQAAALRSHLNSIPMVEWVKDDAKMILALLDRAAAKPPASGVDAVIEAAREFCRRVEAGEVRSKRSYAAFKAALASLPPAATSGSEAGGEIDATQKLLDKALTVLGRCHTVLFNMAKENEGAIFNRWPIHHEPLRSDARNLLPLIDEVLGHD